jgi:hypothetical protein
MSQALPSHVINLLVGPQLVGCELLLSIRVHAADLTWLLEITSTSIYSVRRAHLCKIRAWNLIDALTGHGA